MCVVCRVFYSNEWSTDIHLRQSTAERCAHQKAKGEKPQYKIYTKRCATGRLRVDSILLLCKWCAVSTRRKTTVGERAYAASSTVWLNRMLGTRSALNVFFVRFSVLNVFGRTVCVFNIIIIVVADDWVEGIPICWRMCELRHPLRYRLRATVTARITRG